MRICMLWSNKPRSAVLNVKIKSWKCHSPPNAETKKIILLTRISMDKWFALQNIFATYCQLSCQLTIYIKLKSSKNWDLQKKIKFSFWRFFPFLTCKSFPLSVITFIISLSEAQKRQIICAEFHLIELISFPFGWRIEKFGRFPEIRFSLLVTHIRPVDGARDIKSPFCSMSPISHRSFLLSLFFSLCLLKR